MIATRTFHIGHALLGFTIALLAPVVLLGVTVLLTLPRGADALVIIFGTMLTGGGLLLLTSLAVGGSYLRRRRVDVGIGILVGGTLPALAAILAVILI